MRAKNNVVLIWTLVVLLGLGSVFIWNTLLLQNKSDVLTVTFFDVGQGDGIFIETPNGTKVLIDGGKGKQILRSLGNELSFFERDIDMVIATHPDLDHIGGLPHVFERYNIISFLHSGVEDGGADNQALLSAVAFEGISTENVEHKNSYVLDEDVYLEILFPDRPANMLEANTGSVVLKVTYRETSFLLTGDSPAGIESYLVSLYGKNLKSTVLKLGHHGSKTSSTLMFLGYVDPTYAVISASCDNSYGHPHKEVLDRLEVLDIEELSTCKHGDVVFESDGKEVYVK